MQDDIDKILEEKIRSMRGLYLKTLQGHTDKLKEILLLCQKNKLASENSIELLSNAHSLAGNGAIFGFVEVSELGMILHDNLRNNPDANADTFISQISALIEACDTALSSKPSHSNPVKNHEILSTEKDKPLLLIIDDDENIRSAMKELLKDHTRIVIGKSSTEILGLIKANKIDLIILDDQITEDASSLQILEEIQLSADIKDIPIIMLTAIDKVDKIMGGLMAGTFDYITKPFTPEKLAEKIRVRLEWTHKQILIADDDEAVRELLKHKFSNAGCRVVSVEDGNQAWYRLQKQNFALVILDCMMPGFDGLTILRMMKENPKLADTPLILLTARHSSSDITEGLNAGAADYICKPFNPDELVTRCIQFLRPSTKL